jgi:hypothetical protein
VQRQAHRQPGALPASWRRTQLDRLQGALVTVGNLDIAKNQTRHWRTDSEVAVEPLAQRSEVACTWRLSAIERGLQQRRLALPHGARAAFFHAWNGNQTG